MSIYTILGKKYYDRAFGLVDVLERLTGSGDAISRLVGTYLPILKLMQGHIAFL
jgi:hypothetical protein